MPTSAVDVQSGALSSYGNDSPAEIANPATTVLDCCVACFNALTACLYLLAFLPAIHHHGRAWRTPSSPAQAAVCPAGVSSQDTLFPFGVDPSPDPSGFPPRPYVVEALPFL